jgi:hypothetical protein
MNPVFDRKPLGLVEPQSAAKSLYRSRPFRATSIPSDLWRDTPSALQVINPNVRVEDEELDAMRPSLRILSKPDHVSLFFWFLQLDRITSGQVEDLLEWKDAGWNSPLIVLSAACRIGVLKVEFGEWRLTDFGIRFVHDWKPETSTPLQMFERSWGANLAVRLRAAIRWGWLVLQKEQLSVRVLRELADCPTGLTHQQLTSGTVPREEVLRALAAGSAIGAVWFTGWRWETTMFGAYLVFHPQSALKSPFARSG